MRFLHIYAGLPQSGKTFFAERFANLYHQSKTGYVFAYNKGKPADFKDYELLEFMGFEETAETYHSQSRASLTRYRNFPKIEYFRLNGRVHKIRDINKVCYGKKVCSYRMFNKREEARIFDVFFQYMAHCLVILDDARAINRRVGDSAIQLFGRQNHTGLRSSSPLYRGKGLDIITIYHNADRVNEELYDYATDMIIFKCNRLPDSKRMSNPALYDEIKKTFDVLLEAPKYTCYQINMRGAEIESKLINSKKITQNGS